MSDILTFTAPETRWLSNMAFVDIRHKGILYISTENFYQAMKFDETDLIRLNDGNYVLSLRKHIAQNLSPKQSKVFGKNHPMTNTVFEQCKLDIMLYAQREKYKQEPFKSRLLETGDCHVEEGNWWNDKFWGTDMKTREGENHLGKIIMKVRDELRGVKFES